MALKFGPGWTEPVVLDNWTIPGEPVFAESNAFKRLLRDLRRYVLDEVAGRSFLVAGHRGAGKTTTVVQAVRRLDRELLGLSADTQFVALGRRGRLQRPLIVKLVGRSLVAPPPRQMEVEEQQRSDGSKDAATDGNGKKDPGAAHCTKKGSDHVESALVHITIALYRAFADEVARGFATHATSGAERGLADRLELASQLSLELDGAPEPGLLRWYWNRVGRLDKGVLWPSRTDQTMERKNLRGQGMKEIVALATAAQAFQVCSGAVTYKVSSHDTATNERKSETSLDVSETVNRVGALGAGALAGSVVGVSETAALGVGTGLLVWLLSGLTLRWTATRARKSERSLDYTFLRDRSIQTLERDLPLVIARIREAGLAPVFVIDELDKLPKASEKIKRIIDRLKNLVSDYGFFCFLTDRGYYDEIEGKVAGAAYPTEHTYFSQRILVLNRPADLFNYVRDRLTPEGMSATALPPALAVPISVFALAVIFRSKLNFADMTRELARFAGDGDVLSWSEADLQRPGELRLAATIQLAIDQVLLDMKIGDRFESDAGFEQLAIDALYYVPRCWEKGAKAVKVDRGTLRDELVDRMESLTPDSEEDEGDRTCRASRPDPQPAPPPDEPDEAQDGPTIDESDLDELEAMVARVVDYLGDFKNLAKAVGSREDETSSHAAIVIVEKEHLLKPAGADTPGYFQFTLDQLGNSRAEAEMAAPGHATRARRSDAVRAAAEESPLALLESFSKLLNTAGVSVDDLVRNRVLPGTLSELLLQTALSDLKAAASDSAPLELLRRGLDGRLAFHQALDSYGGRLADILVLLAQIRLEFSLGGAPPVLLDRISRYWVLDTARFEPVGWERALDRNAINATAGSVVYFHRRYANLIRRLSRQVPTTQALNEAGRWMTWRESLLGYLFRSQPATVPVDYEDLALAAIGRGPGSLFRANLAEMDLIDWSRAARAALWTEEGRGTAPLWLLFAALRALDFDQDRLADIPRMLPSPYGAALLPDDMSAIDELIRSARTRPAGFVHIFPDEALVSRPVDIPRSRPSITIGTAELETYMSALNWLADYKLIEGITDEIG